MENFVLVQMMESVNQAAHDFDGLVLSQVLSLLYIRVEIAPVTELHDQVEIVRSLFHIVKSNYV